jgi:hypothetical protein
MPRGPKGERRPADVIGAAVKVMKIATGEIPEDYGLTPEDQGKDPAAVALGRKGGKARAAGMSALKRKEIAQKAAKKDGIALDGDNFFNHKCGRKNYRGSCMLVPRIYRHEWEVVARLVPFGVTRAELVEVVRGVVSARADTAPNDPLGAAGQFAYIFGTRYLRTLFRSKGYLLHREENIESVRHPKRALTIVYQSVDIAASEDDPRAACGKGGADRVIDAAQGRLAFPETPQHEGGVNTGVWFFCVSVQSVQNNDDDNVDVRAELSLPAGISGSNFDGFIERIFIVQEGDWPKLSTREEGDSDAPQFEPVVTRK